MNRIDRLFGILTALQSRKYMTAEKISEKFQISIRTVYRDIKALGELGIPVSFEQHKGYFVVQGYFLPPISFSTEEANALLLMETMVQSFADKSIRKHYTTLATKVQAVLGTAQKEKIGLLSNSIRFQMPDRFNNDYEYLSVIQTTISAKNILYIEYQNLKAEVSKRKIEPIGLIFYAFSWHLIGWCHMRREYRDFKVSRILKIQDTGMPFMKKNHIALKDYMSELPVDF